MGLQVMRTGSAEYGRWIKVLLCGEPGSGKTRFGRSWPNPFYANAEGGLMSVARDKLPYATIRSSDDLLELYQALSLEPDARAEKMAEFAGLDQPLPVETVLIDTIDEVQRILVKERLAEKKSESLAMQDWGWLGDKLRGIVRGFRNLDMHVIFTCHMKGTKDEESGRVSFGPALQGAMGDEIPGYVDLAVLLQGRPVATIVDGESRRQIVRFLQTYPDGNRPWIKDRSGTLPLELELDFDSDYKRLDSLIYGGDGAAVIPPPAEPSAVVEPQSPTGLETAAAEDGGPGDEVPPTPDPDPEPPAQPEESAPPTEPEPEATPEPEAKPEPEAEPEKQPEEAVSTGETVPGEPPGLPNCTVCGEQVEDPNIAELSALRYHEPLCRKHFAERKKRR